MHLRIAIDYSSQYSIVEAARRASRDADFTGTVSSVAARSRSCAYPPDVDLLIRTDPSSV